MRLNSKKTLHSHPMSQIGFANGKIILSGEYAVMFGYPGIAFPSRHCIKVTYNDQMVDSDKLFTSWKGITVPSHWDMYLRHIVHEAEHMTGEHYHGMLAVESYLPLGKGMGASTALLIATLRCLVGEDCQKEAEAIEKELNPTGSGIDFAVIWHNKPLKFRKGHPHATFDLPKTLPANICLIDTGEPEQTTSELATLVQSRRTELEDALKTIGNCTERILQGINLVDVLPDHHRAQVTLGVVPSKVLLFIGAIEEIDGAGKIIGAGSRTGGGGIVLATGNEADLHALVAAHGYRIMEENVVL